MATTITGPVLLKRRAAGGGAGAPATLRSGEAAWNNADNTLYIGAGDNGSGLATQILAIAGYQKTVNLAGAQTIGGIKTFDSPPVVPSPANANDAANKRYVDEAMAGAGVGDMLKSVYDTNNNGKVDAAQAADAAPWGGITGKPTQFAPEPHDASLVTSGTFPIERLPAALFAAPIVSSGAIASLTAGQQANILGGTHVVTTDGRTWIYSGTGSKTVEASYTELADKTPEWSIIANRPTTIAGYGLTDAQPKDPTLTALAGLSGVADKGIMFTADDVVTTFTLTSFARQLLDDANQATMRDTLGLGTLAVQNANNVALTGGTINGVTINDGVWDGGTF